MLRRALSFLGLFGLDPRVTISSFRGLPAYFRDLRTLQAQSRTATRPIPLSRLYPCLGDRYAESGSASGHYFHQDLLVARRIHDRRPDRHIDVGSRIDGFVAHVAAFRPIEVIDLRPLPNDIPNVTFRQADLMAPLQDQLRECCDSLSCLHALEHFGLGRYGDPVEYDGHLRGLDNLHGILKQGGTFYLSVPIGPQRIEFNAHRVFSVRYMLECLENRFRVERFSYVDDRGDLQEDTPITDEGARSNFGCTFGCGIFELTKS